MFPKDLDGINVVNLPKICNWHLIPKTVMKLLFKNGHSIFLIPKYLTQRPPSGDLNDLKMRAQKIFIHIPDLEKRWQGADC